MTLHQTAVYDLNNITQPLVSIVFRAHLLSKRFTIHKQLLLQAAAYGAVHNLRLHLFAGF